MIKLVRKGNQVVAELNTGRGWSYNLVWAAGGGDDHAMFVRDAIAKNIGDVMEFARSQAYDAGWHDAKSKKANARKTWFSRAVSME